MSEEKTDGCRNQGILKMHIFDAGGEGDGIAGHGGDGAIEEVNSLRSNRGDDAGMRAGTRAEGEGVAPEATMRGRKGAFRSNERRR